MFGEQAKIESVALCEEGVHYYFLKKSKDKAQPFDDDEVVPIRDW